MNSLAAHKDIYWTRKIQGIGDEAGMVGEFCVNWGFDSLRHRIAELREMEDERQSQKHKHNLKAAQRRRHEDRANPEEIAGIQGRERNARLFD